MTTPTGHAGPQPGGADTAALVARVTVVERLLAEQTRIWQEQAAELREAALYLHEQLGDLHEQLSTPAPPPAAGPAMPLGPLVPVGWAGTATAQDVMALAGWVDWLTTTYSFTMPLRVPRCWPQHPGAVEELAALHAAWRAATAGTRDSRTGGATDAMLSWHERALFPVLKRLRTAYDTGGCETSSGHRDERGPDRRTDTGPLTALLRQIEQRPQP